MLKREKKVSHKICQSKDACYKSFLKKKMNSISQYINTSRKQSDNSSLKKRKNQIQPKENFQANRISKLIQQLFSYRGTWTS